MVGKCRVANGVYGGNFGLFNHALLMSVEFTENPLYLGDLFPGIKVSTALFLR